MIRKDGYAKVLDFGLAKLADDQLSKSRSKASRVDTRPGVVMGTVAYMSPEQARGKNVDTRTDIFSLGIVLYEMLTRRQPFTGETNSHAIVAIIEKDPPPFDSESLNIPPALERITRSCLAKDAANRYQTAGDLIDELKTLRKRLEFEAELERSVAPGAEARTAVFDAVEDQPETTGATVAVMPFENMSPGKDGDYFSDGLAEELLNVLSKIRGLRVAARTSAFSFKGKQTTIAEIGRTLNVESILEGSIRMAGNRVRISVQLVNVADGYQLWSDTYDRTMDDIFAVQDDIAQSVVEELRVHLLGQPPGQNTTKQVKQEIANAARGRADDPEAQRLMLLGLYFLDKTTPEDMTKAISYFQEALGRDPGFARCWAELGLAYSVQAGKAWVPFEEGFAKAREALEQALALEPHLAEGHAGLGRILATHDMDLISALASYEKALELAPGNSRVLDGASILKFKLGDFDEALELSRRVVAQDPLSGSIWHNLGFISHGAGLLAEAEYAFGKALELGPQRMLSTAMLSTVLLDEGRNDEAVATAAAEPDEFWRLWAEAIVFYRSGRKQEAEDALERLLGDADDGAFQVAEVFARRDEADKAFEWLERAAHERDPGTTHTMVSPQLRDLHDDPRWRPLLVKLGLKPA